MDTVVWFVRHGATEATGAGRYCGHRDVALSAGGEEQAAGLVATLPSPSEALAWTSDLRRCRTTAALAGFPDATVDPRLREIDFGDIEGQRWDDLTVQQRAELSDFDRFCPAGGESVAQLRVRVWDFLGELGPGTHVVFTHGGLIRTLLRDCGSDQAIAPAQPVRLRWFGSDATTMRPWPVDP